MGTNDLIESKKQTNDAYSSWEEILFGVPLDSMFRLLLFNIFICDLFSIMNNVNFASYADNTPYVIVYGITQVIESFCWFVNN